MIENEKNGELESDKQNQKTVKEPNRLLIEILILTVICAVISGSIYYYRTNFLELTSLENNVFRAVRMTLVYLFIPLFWLVKIRGFKFQDLGFSTKNLLFSIVLGLAVYSIALAVFLILLGNPEFDRYFKWGSDLPAAEFAATMALIAWMAAVTDIWTRGMIMMPVLKFHGILMAVFLQNLVWFTAHVYEIEFLRGSLTLAGAVALTLALGILGDFAAIRTKNIIGLSVGHIFLNLAFFGYVRIVF
jgi:hypothetical protein